jgi:hypothetical protein
MLCHHKQRLIGVVDIDLVGRISSHHVQDSETTTWMPIDPLPEMQDIALMDDDWLALGNLALDFGGRDDTVSRHDAGWRWRWW